MSRDRGRIVKNKINIELEQISAVPEDLLLDHVAMLGQNIRGSVQLMEPEILGLGQPHPIEPALMAGKLGAWPIQALRRHRQQGGLMRGLELLLLHMLLDRLTNAELLPQRFGDMDNAEIEAVLDLNIRSGAEH